MTTVHQIKIAVQLHLIAIVSVTASSFRTDTLALKLVKEIWGFRMTFGCVFSGRTFVRDWTSHVALWDWPRFQECVSHTVAVASVKTQDLLLHTLSHMNLVISKNLSVCVVCFGLFSSTNSSVCAYMLYMLTVHTVCTCALSL